MAAALDVTAAAPARPAATSSSSGSPMSWAMSDLVLSKLDSAIGLARASCVSTEWRQLGSCDRAWQAFCLAEWPSLSSHEGRSLVFGADNVAADRHAHDDQARHISGLIHGPFKHHYAMRSSAKRKYLQMAQQPPIIPHAEYTRHEYKSRNQAPIIKLRKVHRLQDVSRCSSKNIASSADVLQQCNNGSTTTAAGLAQLTEPQHIFYRFRRSDSNNIVAGLSCAPCPLFDAYKLQIDDLVFLVDVKYRGEVVFSLVRNGSDAVSPMNAIGFFHISTPVQPTEVVARRLQPGADQYGGSGPTDAWSQDEVRQFEVSLAVMCKPSALKKLSASMSGAASCGCTSSSNDSSCTLQHDKVFQMFYCTPPSAPPPSSSSDQQYSHFAIGGAAAGRRRGTSTVTGNMCFYTDIFQPISAAVAAASCNCAHRDDDSRPHADDQDCIGTDAQHQGIDIQYQRDEPIITCCSHFQSTSTYEGQLKIDFNCQRSPITSPSTGCTYAYTNFRPSAVSFTVLDNTDGSWGCVTQAQLLPFLQHALLGDHCHRHYRHP